MKSTKISLKDLLNKKHLHEAEEEKPAEGGEDKGEEGGEEENPFAAAEEEGGDKGEEGGGEENNRDCASSGERTRRSPNQSCYGNFGVIGL